MEALILYFVLFFPGISVSPWLGVEMPLTIPFSILRELGHTLTYKLPAIALLLYLISNKKGVSGLKDLAPRKRDILPFAIGLPVLIVIGLSIASLISASGTAMPPPRIEGPYNFIGWLVVILACLGTGYLEELYFRYYLLAKMENIIPQTAVRVLFSTILFAVVHMYYGPWGILNAAIAGLFLSVLFLRTRSLHGIAVAHAGYNMFVYFMGTV